MSSTSKLIPLELLQEAWESYDRRIGVSPNTEQNQALLSYNNSEVPDSPFNPMRDEIMQYIKEHKNMLSLPCDGNCYGHTDGVVVFCYQKLMEEKNGS